MTESQLHELLTRLPPEQGRRGRDCPDEGRLAAYSDARLDGEARAGLESHLADCPACLGQVAFLAHARATGLPAAVPCRWIDAALHRSTPRQSRLVPFTAGSLAGALAATLLLLFALPGGDPLRIDRGPGATRAAAAATRPPALAGAAPVLVEPRDGATVPRAGIEVRWSAVPDALFYTVQLLGPEGDLLWEGRTDGTELLLPDPPPLAAAGSCYVWVEAHFSGGASSRSPAVAFGLDPP